MGFRLNAGLFYLESVLGVWILDGFEVKFNGNITGSWTV